MFFKNPRGARLKFHVVGCITQRKTNVCIVTFVQHWRICEFEKKTEPKHANLILGSSNIFFSLQFWIPQNRKVCISTQSFPNWIPQRIFKNLKTETTQRLKISWGRPFKNAAWALFENLALFEMSFSQMLNENVSKRWRGTKLLNLCRVEWKKTCIVINCKTCIWCVKHAIHVRHLKGIGPVFCGLNR